MKFTWRGAKHSPFFGQQKNEVQQEVEHDVEAKQVLKGLMGVEMEDLPDAGHDEGGCCRRAGIKITVR